MPVSPASSSPSQSAASSSNNPREYKALDVYSERSLSSSSSSSSSLSSLAHTPSSPYATTSSSHRGGHNNSNNNNNHEMLQHLSLRMPSLSGYSPFGLHRPPSPPSSPVITALHSEPTSTSSSILSPMARYRRAPAPSESPPLQITSTRYKHTLEVQFPQAIQIQPEMVTVSAKKGDKLSIVADAWHMERNCHYEWEVTFPPRDADMSAVHAKFQPGGQLVIDILRR